MKADVERRERSQAEVIANQAKRLEELDKLYRCERQCVCTMVQKGGASCVICFTPHVSACTPTPPPVESPGLSPPTPPPLSLIQTPISIPPNAREESVMRKKIYNQIEDMKGKIRVYCRVRPILTFEKERGQKVAVDIPDELSIKLQWKDKAREFK
jgi:hypothetical protein